MFSVNVLLYGNYPQLAVRCLCSVICTADWDVIGELRLGLNAVSKATRDVALAAAGGVPCDVHVYEEAGGRNVWKYPMMRRMLHDPDRPVVPQFVMWFDDDSYVMDGLDSRKALGSTWWRRVLDVARDGTPTGNLVGSKYRLVCGLKPGQAEGIKAQKWYNGQPVAGNYTPQFIQGAWWVARTSVLQTWDYPFKELRHNNGDVLLGELYRQRGYGLRHFNEGVAINADERGKESGARRRGDTTPWPWEGWKPGDVPDLSHHDFEVKVRSYPGVRSKGCTVESRKYNPDGSESMTVVFGTLPERTDVPDS
jgi:hypothetical protein